MDDLRGGGGGTYSGAAAVEESFNVLFLARTPLPPEATLRLLPFCPTGAASATASLPLTVGGCREVLK